MICRITAAVLSLLFCTTSHGQILLSQIVGENSSLQRPIATAAEFGELLRRTEISNGDGQMIAYINASKLNKRQFFHLYLMAQAFRAGWFKPVFSQFGSNGEVCSPTELQLQNNFVASYNEPVWCHGEQWRSASWLYKTINEINESERDGDWRLRKIFYLLHTANSDLSPLEVEAAITGRHQGLQPAKFPKKGELPYKSQLPANKDLTVFEGWESWMEPQDERLYSADAVLFARQELVSPHRTAVDLLRTRTMAGIYVSQSSRYLVGNELTLKGAFGINFKSRMIPGAQPNHAPESEYAGLFVIGNTVVLDSAESGHQYGYLDYSDFYQYPPLTINGDGSTGLVLLSRKIAIGQFLSDRMRRIWNKIGEQEFPTTNGCGIDERTIAFSLKQIAPENIQGASLTKALKGQNCFDRLFAAWPGVVQEELDSRPSHILHRYVHVILGGLRRSAYAVSDIDSAGAFFGTKLLENWNVAVVKQLLLQIRSAQLQDARDDIGNLVRDAESIRPRFLVNPSSASVNELLKTFQEINDIKSTIRGRRILIRGSSMPDAPSIASAILLGDAASRDTWLVPSEVSLMPLQTSSSAYKFGRVSTENAPGSTTIRLQVILDLQVSPNLQYEVKRALDARGLRFAGMASDVDFIRLRQSTSLDWSIESQSKIGPSRFIVTIRCTQDYFPILSAELARSPGLPIQIDWQHQTDQAVNSSMVGPITGVLRFQGIATTLRPDADGRVRNPASLPMEIVAVLTNGAFHPVSPTIPLRDGEEVVLSSNTIGSNLQGKVEMVSAIWDPSAKIPFQDKIDFVAPTWSIVPIQIQNLSDFINQRKVVAAEVWVGAIDDLGKKIYEDIKIDLSQYGMQDARQELKLFLPPGFQLQYSSQFLLDDGSRLQGPSGKTQALQISIRYAQNF